jgi:hypothetical protein
MTREEQQNKAWRKEGKQEERKKERRNNARTTKYIFAVWLPFTSNPL